MVQEREKEGQIWPYIYILGVKIGGLRYLIRPILALKMRILGLSYFGLPGRFLIPGDIRTQLRPEPPERSAVVYLYPDPRYHSQVGFPFH